jgi:hypothetical protein
MRRALLLAGAALALALSAALALLALDVGRWPDAIDASDARYRVAPTEEHLWRPTERVPFGLSRTLLAIDDDLAYRRAVQALRLGRLEGQYVSDPRLTLLRVEGQGRLAEIARGSGDPVRRAQAANLLGVISLVSLVAEERDRTTLLADAINRFRTAIALDPSSEYAKYNLELSLQRQRELELGEGSGGVNPSPGSEGSQGAGTGEPGSGY